MFSQEISSTKAYVRFLAFFVAAGVVWMKFSWMVINWIMRKRKK